MNQKQEYMLTMWAATDNVLNTYENTWAILPAFAQGVRNFRKAWHTLPDSTRQQLSILSHHTRRRLQLRNHLTELALQIATNLQAWATDHEDPLTFNRAGFRKYQFDAMRDAVFKSTVLLLLSLAETHAAHLVGYGTDMRAIEAMRTAIRNYAAAIASPPDVVTDRPDDSIRLPELIRNGNAFLKNLDRLVSNFRLTAPDFVHDYHSARKVVIISNTAVDD